MTDDSKGEPFSVWFPTGCPREKAWWKARRGKGEWLLSKIRQELIDDPVVIEAEMRDKEAELEGLRKKLEAIRLRKPTPVQAHPDRVVDPFIFNFPTQVKYQVKIGNMRRVRELEDEARQHGIPEEEIISAISEAGGQS